LWERYKDNGKFGFGDKTRFSSHNPADGHIYWKGTLFYIELKSSKSSSVSFELSDTGKKPSIKYYQIKSLLERVAYDGVYCGFIIWFLDRETKTRTIEGGTYYIDVNDFVAWAEKCGKKSINIDDAKEIGIPVPFKKLKVNYRYDIEELVKRITND
jgi:penicillin-binding protein-related factor A (putative recombinase)